MVRTGCQRGGCVMPRGLRARTRTTANAACARWRSATSPGRSAESTGDISVGEGGTGVLPFVQDSAPGLLPRVRHPTDLRVPGLGRGAPRHRRSRRVREVLSGGALRLGEHRGLFFSDDGLPRERMEDGKRFVAKWRAAHGAGLTKGRVPQERAGSTLGPCSGTWTEVVLAGCTTRPAGTRIGPFAHAHERVTR
jgi:hypothetical protein